jgi:uncharacterized protein
METISLEAAQNIMLAVQGLLEPPPAISSKQQVLDSVRRMGVLQIDSIHVVARSPYLVLFSRLGHFPPRWLDELAAEGALFEYWAHAACFIPIEDYPLFRRLMLEDQHPHYISDEWLAERQHTTEAILARIRQEGPLRSADFKQTKRPGMWWNWKDEKRILEHLFNQGDLMISQRIKFQRVYDLRERVLPGWRDERTPDAKMVKHNLILRSARCLGITRPEWVADYYRLPKKGVADELAAMSTAGELFPLQVEGFEGLFYIHQDHFSLFEKIKGGELKATHTTLLSPFDPLVWDRARARQLFNFDYSIEAYLPAPKRRYGYFCLPILNRGRLIGRLDAKAHRADKSFEVRSLYLESGINPDESMLMDIAGALKSCANWHGCPKVKITSTASPDVVEHLMQILN